MPTRVLRLRKCQDGYHRTCWIDDQGGRHQRSFGINAEAARNRFARFFADWVADPHVRNPSNETPRTIRQAWEQFEKHAEKYYRRADGTATGEAPNIALAMQYVLGRFGDLSPAEFTPKLLKVCRRAMIADDLATTTINAWVGKIRQVWRWMVEEELAPAESWHGLRAIKPVQPGRGEGRTVEAVRCVPEAHVVATIGRLPATLAAMVELQLLTGMRPGELCGMRAMDVETGGKVWLYRPATHKTAHRGRDRIVMIGPRGQEIVKKRLAGRAVDAVLFSPRDTVRDIGRTPGAGIALKYSKDAYALAIRRACLEEPGIPTWSPNRLRHNAATRLRKEFGLDVAQVVLGHRRADVTQVYAELDLAKAAEALERVG